MWQDSVAESLFGGAVAVIALTGINPLVLRVNLWLATIVPAYDPVLTMLVLAVFLSAACVLGGIGLKEYVRRGVQVPAVPQHSRRRPARLRHRSPAPVPRHLI